MKITKFIPVLILLLASIILSACSGGVGANNFPGMTVDGNLAYIAYGAQVRSVNLEDGTIPWRFPEKVENKAYYTAPLVTEKYIIITNYSGDLYALNKDGKAAWSAPFVAKGRWYGAPILCGDLIVGANGDNNLYALNMNGGVEWEITPTVAAEQLPTNAKWGNFWSAPVCDEKTIYLASLDHQLFAIDNTTHKIKWAVNLESPAIAAPVLHEGYVYVGTIGGDLFKINTEDNHDVVTKHLDGEIWTRPVFKNTTLFIGVKPTKKTGKIYLLSTKDLKEAAKPTDTESPVTTMGVIVQDGVAFGTEGGIFYKSSFDGEVVKWQNTIPGKVYTDPVYANEKLWVAVFGGEDLLRYFNSAGNLSESFRISAK